MSAINALAAPITSAPATGTTAADLAKRGQIEKTAQEFESAFLSIMMQQMFTATDTSAPFGGGQGEAMFRSFLTEAFAKETTKSGGVGIADTVAREMLKLQGLEQE